MFGHRPDAGCSSCPSPPGEKTSVGPWNGLLRVPCSWRARPDWSLWRCLPLDQGSGQVEPWEKWSHMFHFPEVQLGVLMGASEGHKGAHNENKTPRCPLVPVLGLKPETSYAPSKHILTEQYPQLCALPIQFGVILKCVPQVSSSLVPLYVLFYFFIPRKVRNNRKLRPGRMGGGKRNQGKWAQCL